MAKRGVDALSKHRGDLMGSNFQLRKRKIETEDKGLLQCRDKDLGHLGDKV